MRRIQVEDRSGVRWIILSGEMDQADVLEFKPEFDEAIRSAPGDVVLEMSRVSFLGTLGIGLIGWAQDQVEEKGATLRLGAVPEFIEKTLRTMNLDELFERV